MPSEQNRLKAGDRQIRVHMEWEWTLHLGDGEVQSRAEIELQLKVCELDKENEKFQKVKVLQATPAELRRKKRRDVLKRL